MRTIPDPGFADDVGGVDPRLAKALEAYAADPETRKNQALAVLQGTRLFVPVMAALDEVEYDDRGVAHDKSSDMSTVLMRGHDGRLALLVFTSTESLLLWNPLARPVPVLAPKAAEAALQDSASAMVVDVAGPVRFVVEQDDLGHLAQGHTLVQLDDRFAWTKPSA